MYQNYISCIICCILIIQIFTFFTVIIFIFLIINKIVILNIIYIIIMITIFFLFKRCVPPDVNNINLTHYIYTVHRFLNFANVWSGLHFIYFALAPAHNNGPDPSPSPFPASFAHSPTLQTIHITLHLNINSSGRQEGRRADKKPPGNRSNGSTRPYLRIVHCLPMDFLKGWALFPPLHNGNATSWKITATALHCKKKTNKPGQNKGELAHRRGGKNPVTSISDHKEAHLMRR